MIFIIYEEIALLCLLALDLYCQEIVLMDL